MMMLRRTLIAALAAGTLAAWASPSPALTILDFAGFSNPPAGFQLNGSASVLSGGTLRLVPDAEGEDGSMFLSVPISLLGNDFKARFRFRITSSVNGSGLRSDGLAFVVQSDPRGASALGGGGEGIGYGDNPLDPANPGINPSVGVEFDTYQNSGDPDNNHVGITPDGQIFNYFAVATPSWRLDDGEIKTASIRYNHRTHRLRVHVTTKGPGSTSPLTFAVHVDVTAITGNRVRFGFTAATGNGFANFDVLKWRLIVAPTIFAGTPGRPNCHGKSVSALARRYGGVHNAAEALGYGSVSALQGAIMEYCGG